MREWSEKWFMSEPTESKSSVGNSMPDRMKKAITYALNREKNLRRAGSEFDTLQFRHT